MFPNMYKLLEETNDLLKKYTVIFFWAETIKESGGFGSKLSFSLDLSNGSQGTT